MEVHQRRINVVRRRSRRCCRRHLTLVLVVLLHLDFVIVVEDDTLCRCHLLSCGAGRYGVDIVRRATRHRLRLLVLLLVLFLGLRASCVGAGAVYALGLLRRALIVHSWSAVCSQTDDLFLLAITFSVAAVTLRLRRRAFERHLPLSWIQLHLHLWLSLGGGNRERRHGDWRWHTSVVLVGREVHIKDQNKFWGVAEARINL